MNNALKLDEFTLEMRLHYIDTSLADLDRVKNFGNDLQELKPILESWIPEARSNQMEHFIKLLEYLRGAIASGGLPNGEGREGVVIQTLGEYFEVLKSQADSQDLHDRFLALFQEGVEGGSQLYLQCESFGHHFVVPVKSVVEISNQKKIYSLPRKRKGLLGLVAFRGQGIPVVDLGSFGFATGMGGNESGERAKSFFVICQYQTEIFALEVQHTEEVLTLRPDEFQKSTGAATWSPVVEKFVVYGDRTLMLIDLEKLVGHE